MTAVSWLLENADAVVRYRTQTELVNITDKEQLQDSLAAVLALPQTQKRIGLLGSLDYDRVHGSDHTHLENILPMLGDFGLDYNVDAVKHIIRDNIDTSKIITGYSYYNKIHAYPFLLRLKIPISELLDFAIERINTIHDFTRHMDFDIYDGAANFTGVPKPF